ncbi:hypothetical protein PCL_07016 [Purpureocillium lilacinum]|uniref:Uncharacterized protein n=1 Tax=Purpureocillium lilacinum TaxID=33203 RepID=A0A2U3DT43_PURLI|nr:hypothetical protein PCL_07016 [Purpureocillium lilacinum]
MFDATKSHDVEETNRILSSVARFFHKANRIDLDISKLLENVDQISHLQLEVLGDTRQQSGRELDAQVAVFHDFLCSISVRIVELSKVAHQGCIVDNIREACLRRLKWDLNAVRARYTAHQKLYQGMCRELVVLEEDLKAAVAACPKCQQKGTGAVGVTGPNDARDRYHGHSRRRATGLGQFFARPDEIRQSHAMPVQSIEDHIATATRVVSGGNEAAGYNNVHGRHIHKLK